MILKLKISAHADVPDLSRSDQQGIQEDIVTRHHAVEAMTRAFIKYDEEIGEVRHMHPSEILATEFSLEEREEAKELQKSGKIQWECSVYLVNHGIYDVIKDNRQAE